MKPLQALDVGRFEKTDVLLALNRASRSLGELKGALASMPNQQILINTLSIQEAKDSSEIENVVTTQDELFRAELVPETLRTAEAKEVHRYGDALRMGFESVGRTGLITTANLVAIQAELMGSSTGIRTLPGTVLRNSTEDVVYTPPQSYDEIVGDLHQLAAFINDDAAFSADPLVKMALIHHQFESIHPFYDGNGRTGRILNVLYLVKSSLLDLPVVYLSRPLLKRKADYYRLLQAVRDEDEWEAWTIFMLEAVESSAGEAVTTIRAIGKAMMQVKHKIRAEYRFYSQDLVNHLFSHPYTKIDLVARALGLSRITATKYLDELVAGGVLEKVRLGRSYYFINSALWKILEAG